MSLTLAQKLWHGKPLRSAWCEQKNTQSWDGSRLDTICPGSFKQLWNPLIRESRRVWGEKMERWKSNQRASRVLKGSEGEGWREKPVSLNNHISRFLRNWYLRQPRKIGTEHSSSLILQLHPSHCLPIPTILLSAILPSREFGWHQSAGN